MENFYIRKEASAGKLLIVADDFTGASDTGVQFSRNNLQAMVITGTEGIIENLDKCDVLAVDTESRFDDASTAASKVHEVGKIATTGNIRYFYKKIDSTMRGNIGAEISALMDSLGAEHTYVVPALPEYGRTTFNGKVYVNGILLEETEFSKDPKNPVRESFIPKIIARQTDKKTALIIHEYIVAGREVLTEKLQFHRDAGVKIIIFDAKHEKDLDLIASVISEFSEKSIFAGCSGLAEYLAKYLFSGKEKKSGVVIAGSVSDVTRGQITFAVHYLPVKLVDINTSRIFSAERSGEKQRILDIVKDSALKGEDVIIRSAPNREVVNKTFEIGEEAGLTRDAVSEAIALFLGEAAGDIIRGGSIGGVLLTGGDTAVKTVQNLNVRGVILQDEVVHGIPYGRFVGEEFNKILVISKAGGFGSEDAIFRVLNFLRNV
jgi:D-threonate/D-erythronate kinase